LEFSQTKKKSLDASLVVVANKQKKMIGLWNECGSFEAFGLPPLKAEKRRSKLSRNND
jgi:hypothetical protein